jgi:hypothetical protein
VFPSFMSKYYLCRNYFYKGDYAKAAEEGAKAAGIGRKIGLVNTPDFNYLLTHLGLALTRTERAKEGEPLMRESLEWVRKAAPQDLPKIAAGEGALGECLSVQARYSEAEPLLLQSYESMKNLMAADSPGIKLALHRIVTLYENWKKPELASKYRALSQS